MRDALGVVFDMDGLMLDTERLFFRAYQQAAQEHGVHFSRQMYMKMIGYRADSSQRILRGELGPDAPAEEIIESARRHYYSFIEKEGIPVRPGLYEVLDYLDEYEIPRAVATSTIQDLAVEKLRRVDLFHRVDAVATGDMVQEGKPAPDIYEKAAEMLDLSPRHCLALEDSLTGLSAARHAGMITVLIPDLCDTNTRSRLMSQYIFSNLGEFLARFREEREGVGSRAPF